MQQLSGVDAGFLNMETPTQFGHVCSINVFDGGPDVSDADWVLITSPVFTATLSMWP